MKKSRICMTIVLSLIVFISGYSQSASQGKLKVGAAKVDITDALQQGENTLEIEVTNLWVNRMIGDQQPGVKEKHTFTTQQSYSADSPLLVSGLLGPVKILSETITE